MSTVELEEHVVAAPGESVPRTGDGTRLDEVKRTLALTWTLALSDWKLRFYGSALGALWTLVRPFAMFGVILFVFTKIAKVDSAQTPHYAAYILIAMVLFQFFAEITGGSVASLVAREGLLRKMHFNPIVVPLSIAVTALLNLAMTLVAVLIFAIGNGVTPGWGWLELPIFVLLLFILGVGVGMLLSALYVRYRDIQPIWDVFNQILFYASPILYVATHVPDAYQRIYVATPIAAIFTQMRHAMIDSDAPSVFRALGADWRALIPVAAIMLIFAVGLRYFLRESPRVAENL